ncbi:MAG: transketolase [Treponemataceae bacterium]
MTQDEQKIIENEIREIRCATIDTIGHLGVGHIGGALSICDLLGVLYYKHMSVKPSDPKWADRDRLVLSKGHAGPALYATLAQKSFFPKEWLHTLNEGGTKLPSHCDRTKTPGIDMTTGSLGQGLSAACGIALANKMDGKKNFVFAIIGDGESQEGQNWEAAMFASHQKLSHLITFTDYNKLQIDGYIDDICSLGDIEAKWNAFGWFTQRVDGHNVQALSQAIDEAKKNAQKNEKPSMIIMDTIKGKGGNFCEADPNNHNMTFSKEVAQKAIEALKAGN